MAVVNAVNFLFHKMWENSRVADDLLASHKGLCYMQLVGWLVGYANTISALGILKLKRKTQTLHSDLQCWRFAPHFSVCDDTVTQQAVCMQVF
jgi:hypothetical protein